MAKEFTKKNLQIGDIIETRKEEEGREWTQKWLNVYFW